MTTYVLLECPQCGAQRPHEGTPSSDQLTRALVVHLTKRHPSIPPAEAEETIAQAVSAAEPTTVDADATVEPERWGDYEL